MLKREIKQGRRGKWRWYLRDPALNNKSFAQSSQSYATEDEANKSLEFVKAELVEKTSFNKAKMVAALMVVFILGFLLVMLIYQPAQAQELNSLLLQGGGKWGYVADKFLFALIAFTVMVFVDIGVILCLFKVRWIQELIFENYDEAKEVFQRSIVNSASVSWEQGYIAGQILHGNRTMAGLMLLGLNIAIAICAAWL